MYDFYVYVLTNKPRGTLYTGVTNTIGRRVYEHKFSSKNCFTWKYSLNKLVYYEGFTIAVDAIKREKQLKKWRREWKIKLIEKFNPGWEDLSLKMDIYG